MIPAAFAEDWIDFVLAVRQPLSEPTWENPSVTPAVLRCVVAGFPAAVPASAAASTRATLVEVIANHFFDTVEPPSVRGECRADDRGMRRPMLTRTP